MRQSKKVKLIVGLIVTGCLVGYLVSKVSLANLINTFRSLPLCIWPIGVLLYMGEMVASTLRFRLLLRKVSIGRLFPVVLSHKFFVQLAPLRTGELSYFYFLRKSHVSPESKLAGLLAVRLSDVLILFFVFGVSLIYYREFRERVGSISIVTVSAVSIILSTVLIVGVLTRHLINRLSKCLLRSMAINRTLAFVSKTRKELRLFINRGVLVKLVIYTILVWFPLIVFRIVIVKASGYDIDHYKIVAATTLTVLSAILPVSPVFGLGVNEGVFAGTLILLGVSSQAAITTAFTAHLTRIAIESVFGVGSTVILMRKN